MTPGQALAELIQATATAAGYEIFINHMPDKPDNAILIYEVSGGVLESRKMASGEREEHPALRVLVRGVDSSARAVLQSISDLADTTYKFSLSNGQVLQVITKSNTIGFAGHEPQTRRYVYTQNYRLTLE